MIQSFRLLGLGPGIESFIVKNLPIQEYWQDMKFWWPHNEAIIATLLAYQITGDEKMPNG